jgi:hypothetical protein
VSARSTQARRKAQRSVISGAGFGLVVGLAAVACNSDGATGGADAGHPEKPEASATGGGGSEGRAGGGTTASGGRAVDVDAGTEADADAPVPATEGGTDTTVAKDAGTPPLDADGGILPLVCHGPGSRFASFVFAHEFGDGQDFGQDAFPAPLFGPPRGGGACNGGTDVVSLGNGGSVALGFDGNGIVDGPGADFIVFENPFGTSCDPDRPFAELGTVSVSDDGLRWHEFPCTATTAPFEQCSGYRPVYANADANDIDPTDPAVAGGDAYDLADLGLKHARLVRIVDRVDQVGVAGVYDLDAIALVHPACP